MSSYGTRRASGALPTPIPLPAQIATTSSPSLSSSLSSSIGKSKRPTTTALARRRLSQSNTGLRPPHAAPGIVLSSSMPPLALGRGRNGEEEDDGEIKAGEKGGKKGQVFECEKCSKAYRHATCLSKHRWEHTAHWKEASKLLLSKHQQVQLLEAAAILKAASAGSSLPDSKDFWPAAVSPPSSGLLGSHSINISALTSPRLYPSQSLRSESAFLEAPSEASRNDEEDEEEEEAESVSTGDDMLVGEMFDMELEEEGGRGRSAGEESGYRSMKAPALGFFPRGGVDVVMG